MKLFIVVTFKSVNKALWCCHSNESSLAGLLHSAVAEVEWLMAVNKSMSDDPRRPGHSGRASVIMYTQMLLSKIYLTLKIGYESATY